MTILTKACPVCGEYVVCNDCEVAANKVDISSGEDVLLLDAPKKVETPDYIAG